MVQRRRVGSLIAVLALAGALPVATAAPQASGAKPPIDINRASRADLKTLPGIGDAEAQRIVALRPFRSKAEIVTVAGVPAGVYQSIRHRIIAVQPPPAKASTKAKDARKGGR
jgi:DNA uptake protein ComE-like DNA-binding protein